MPPKLVDVPNPGLRQYLHPNFTARIAREQSINIDADAELGMPLNLVGLPGIFNGDESAVQAPEIPPLPHPKDRPLLRTLTTDAASGVSFLRRTEHITSESKAGNPFLATRVGRPAAAPTPAKPVDKDRNREEPLNILRTIIKGFDIAYPESAHRGTDTTEKVRGHDPSFEDIRAWKKPQHPKKKGLHLVDSFPLVPDLDSVPDSGGYIVVKFATNPIATSNTADERLDVGILRPLELRPELVASVNAAAAINAADPSKPPIGPPPYDYELFIPQSHDSVRMIRRRLDPYDPRRHDPESGNGQLETSSARYERIRVYETTNVTSSTNRRFDEVAMTLYDPAVVGDAANGESGKGVNPRKRKAAYYYPILQRSQIRPRRTTIVKAVMGGVPAKAPEDDENRLDFIDIGFREPNASESERREAQRSYYDPFSVVPSIEGEDQGLASSDDANGDLGVAEI